MKKRIAPLLVLILVLCAVSALGEGSLETAGEALEAASTLDEQLALLFDLSTGHAAELENDGWDLGLTCDPAQALTEELCPSPEARAAMESAEFSPADFEGSKFIAVYQDLDTVRLLGDFQVRIPESMRAASLEEADAVLLLEHRMTPRSDYIGSASDRHYDAYVFHRGDNRLGRIYSVKTTPPLTGYGPLSGEEISLSSLWDGVRRWFFGAIEVDYPEGTAVYRVIGQSCCLSGLDGEFTRYDIPAEVEGYPVTGIENCENKRLEELTLPEGIVWIQTVKCPRLRSMNFPSTLRRITENLEIKGDISLNEGLEEIGDFAVMNGRGETFALPSTLKTIGRGVLESAGSPYIVVPEGVTALQDYFLMWGGRVLSVYVPESVTSFGSDLFHRGRIRIYTPENSAAARYATKNGYSWVACATAEDMPKPYYGIQDGFEFGIVEGEAILTAYRGSASFVRIPDTLGGCPVTTIRDDCFDHHNGVRAIVFPETVCSIEPSTVYRCSGLKAVFLPASIDKFASQAVQGSDEYAVYAPAGSSTAEALEKAGVEYEDRIPGMEAEWQVEPAAWTAEQSTALQTVGATLEFGAYDLDGDETNGFEPVEWTVLAVEDGRSLLISKYALDTQCFKDFTSSFTYWKTSTPRIWMQVDGWNAMLDPAQQALVDVQVNDGIVDTLFLLSAEEAEAYFPSDDARRCSRFPAQGEAVPVSWWLRTEGTGEYDCFAFVGEDGDISVEGASWNYNKGVRPAMWVRTETLSEG